jgi:CDP-paratose 2-epimerase
VVGDVRDKDLVSDMVSGASSVFHLAAQVAATTSLAAPEHDFEVNARGTLNVLEAIRARPSPPPVVYTSTNKLYGALPGVELRVRGARYEPVDADVAAHGVSEARPLDLHCPYGCSKGTADQYVRDWARSFGLDTVVLRVSSSYGPRQFGTENQGWVAHFMLRALRKSPITVYGDGRQVRDVLFVGDLVEALRLARARAKDLRGMAFNIGGGRGNAVSLLDVVERIASLDGKAPELVHDAWRAGDQRWYVSDTRAFERLTGWSPKVGAPEGMARLYRWISEESP